MYALSNKNTIGLRSLQSAHEIREKLAGLVAPHWADGIRRRRRCVANQRFLSEMPVSFTNSGTRLPYKRTDVMSTLADGSGTRSASGICPHTHP